MVCDGGGSGGALTVMVARLITMPTKIPNDPNDDKGVTVAPRGGFTCYIPSVKSKVCGVTHC